jgi:hypothetical protein
MNAEDYLKMPNKINNEIFANLSDVFGKQKLQLTAIKTPMPARLGFTSAMRVLFCSLAG